MPFFGNTVVKLPNDNTILKLDSNTEARAEIKKCYCCLWLRVESEMNSISGLNAGGKEEEKTNANMYVSVNNSNNSRSVTAITVTGTALKPNVIDQCGDFTAWNGLVSLLRRRINQTSYTEQTVFEFLYFYVEEPTDDSILDIDHTVPHMRRSTAILDTT